jgi:hypothetical protein
VSRTSSRSFANGPENWTHATVTRVSCLVRLDSGYTYTCIKRAEMVRELDQFEDELSIARTTGLLLLCLLLLLGSHCLLLTHHVHIVHVIHVHHLLALLLLLSSLQLLLLCLLLSLLLGLLLGILWLILRLSRARLLRSLLVGLLRLRGGRLLR